MKSSNYNASPKPATILSHAPTFVKGLSVFDGLPHKRLGQSFITIFILIKYRKTLSKYFFFFITFYFFRSLIPVPNNSISVKQNDGIVLHFLNHSVISFLTSLQFFHLTLQFGGLFFNFLLKFISKISKLKIIFWKFNIILNPVCCRADIYNGTYFTAGIEDRLSLKTHCLDSSIICTKGNFIFFGGCI